MIVTANGIEIPEVESLFQDAIYQGSSARDVLCIRFSQVPDQAAVEALLAGAVQAEGNDYTGYNTVLSCDITLVRAEDENQTLADLQETQEALAATQTAQLLLVRALAPRLTDAEALDLGPIWPEWKPDTEYAAQDVLRHVGGIYRVVQAHTSQAHQQPGSEGMLAVYRPVQAEPEEGEALPWVSGEEVAQGERREYGGVVYECIGAGGAGANVWTPDAVPALWKAVG